MLLSVQLYTLRDPMSTDPAGTLSQLSEVMSNVELAGTYGLSAREFRGILDDQGFSVTGSHLGLAALESELGKVIDDHRELRCDTIILPWIGKEDYADGWKAFAARLEPIADQLADAGMTFAYHNHAFEFENDGLRTLFRSASDRVKAQIDLGWVQHAGENPAAFVLEMGQRISSVHLKDTMGFEEHQDVLAGEGVVDWKATLAACVEAGVPVGVIEMDNPPGDPLSSVKECYRFYSGHLR